MSVKRIGNWNRARLATKNLGKLMQKYQQEFLEEIGEKGVELLRGHIDSGDLPWRPLSPEYVAQKRAEGYQQEIFIRSRKYYDSLTSEKIGKNGVFVGILHSVQTNEGDRMSDIAIIHEFGALSVGIYPRPLYAPTMNELKEFAFKIGPARKVLHELKRI